MHTKRFLREQSFKKVRHRTATLLPNRLHPGSRRFRIAKTLSRPARRFNAVCAPAGEMALRESVSVLTSSGKGPFIQTVQLGKSSLTASRLAYGCWRIACIGEAAKVSPEAEAGLQTEQGFAQTPLGRINTPVSVEHPQAQDTPFYTPWGSLKYFYTTVTNSVKKFRLRRPFVAPVSQFRSRFCYLFIYDCDKFCKKNFACGGLSSLLSFYFVQDSINYFYATVTNVVNKIWPAAVFRRSCISISLTISLIICVRL